MMKKFEMPEIIFSRFDSGINCDEGLTASGIGQPGEVIVPGIRPKTAVSGEAATSSVYSPSAGVSAYE